MALSWAFRVAGLSLDQVSDILTIAGITPDGLSEESGITRAWFGERPPAGLVEDALPQQGRWESVDQADWVQQFRDAITPVTVGRVTITPPWRAADGPVVHDDGQEDGQIVLVIEPGMAFGTGHHETTTACLAALQELPLAGRRVIDIGTGTGVLALAARALGADSVTAVDNDPEAIAVARANLTAHPLEGITLALGSCADAGPPADVVVVNIITDKLIALAPQVVPLVRPGGVLIASGIAVERIGEAAAAFAAAGIDTSARPGSEWAMLIGRLPG